MASVATSVAPTTEWEPPLSPFLTEPPTSEFVDSPGDDYVDGFNDWNDNGLWMGMWLFTVVIFILLPFVTSKRRRVLCMRGFRERRWINDEEYDQYNSEGQQERRLQQREEAQHHFQTTRTQEDEIRHQYLSVLMEDYTIMLTNSDIHTSEENDDESEEQTEKSSASIGKDQRENDVENQCDATIISSDVGSQDTIDTHCAEVADGDISSPVREKRLNSEDSQDLLTFEFDKNQTVSVPLLGQAVENQKKQTEHNGDSSISRRLVSNGCAICLCQFEADEEVTWSSNPDCCHVFHKDCIINWYLAVGRKTQRRHNRNNPNMTDEEALDLICEFPMNCPCCRQPFCTKTTSSVDEKCDEIEEV